MVGADPFHLLARQHPLDDPRRELRVAFDLGALVVAERPGLPEQRIGDADLADIVDERGLGEEHRPLQRPSCRPRELAGERCDALGVLPGRRILCIDRPGQGPQPQQRL